jgi:hypothetical protein
MHLSSLNTASGILWRRNYRDCRAFDVLFGLGLMRVANADAPKLPEGVKSEGINGFAWGSAVLQTAAEVWSRNYSNICIVQT